MRVLIFGLFACSVLNGCSLSSRLYDQADQFDLIVPGPDSVNVHSGPYTLSDILFRLAPGETLRVIGSGNMGLLYQVQLANGVRGFISKADVDAPSGGNVRDPRRDVGITYDQFEGRTHVFTKEAIPLNSLVTAILSDHDVGLGAKFICSGEEVCTPQIVSLQVLSTSPEWKFLRFHDTVFLVDSTRVSVESSQTGSVLSDGSVQETVHFDVSLSLFERFANAEHLRLRVGVHEATLDFDSRESFRSLLDIARSETSWMGDLQQRLNE